VSWDDYAKEAVEWARDVFPETTAEQEVQKFDEESLEFLEDPCGFEAADCIFCLLIWADRAGVDLLQSAMDKLAIAKKRKHVRQADGTWKHVKE
jgi:hypothetical protein